MKIPSQTIWTKTNQGDELGVLGDVTNVALDTPGKVYGSRKPVAILSSELDNDVEYIMSIVYFDRKYQAVTSDRIFSGGLDGWDWAQDNDLSPTLTNSSDAVVFNNLLTVSYRHTGSEGNIATSNGTGTVVDDRISGSPLTDEVPWPLAVFGSQLVAGSGNLVKLYDTSYVLTQTLTLPTNYEVTTIRTRNNYIYIGTREKFAGEAAVFIWDGNSALFDYQISVGASWVFSMTEYKSSVACVTSQGQLLYINGTSTEELAAFPVYYDPQARWQGSGGLQLNGKVFNRGMATVGDSIYINIEGDLDTGYIPEMKSGLWVYDPEVGLYHRANASTDHVVVDDGITVTDSVITTSAAHSLKTGDAVVFSIVTGLTGVSVNQTYYVSVLSATTLKIANSRKALDEGRFIVISGTVSNDQLSYFPNTDYGLKYSSSGAIAVTAYNETPLDMLSSEVIWGARTESPAGTVRFVLNCFSDQYNISRFETQRIYTDNVKQNWKEVYSFIDGIKYTGEELIVKAQTKSNGELLNLVGVWQDTNVLNTQNTAFTDVWGDIEVGDEIVFTEGYGQGRTAHVTKIENSATVYTLTLDESFGVVGQQSEFYYTTYKKVGVLTKQENISEYLKSLIQETSSPWVRIAIEMRGFQPAVNKLELSNAIKSGTK